MKLTVTYKPDVQSVDAKEKQASIRATGATQGKMVEEYSCSRVTFPAEYPYMILGSIPLVRGKSHKIFLPDIFELVITD